MKQSVILRRVMIIGGVLLIWEASYRMGALNPVLLGAPSLILRAAETDGMVFLHAFRVTAAEIAAAILISWTVGIGFGVVAGAIPGVARTSKPILSWLMAIPLVVLYPVFVAWLGFGVSSKIVFGIVSGVFPIALNALVGVQEVSPGYASMAKAMGASRVQLIFQVMAPLALPAIVSGLRLGTALIVIAVVLSEMLASTDGLGFWISYHRSLFNTGHVYLGVALALTLAALANWALSILERRYTRKTRHQAVL